MDNLLICFNHKDPVPWKQAIEEQLPGTRVILYGEENYGVKTSMALCWNPPADLLLKYPDLQLLQSVGAGVDHLIPLMKSSPSIRVSRIVDPRLSEDLFEFVLSIILFRNRQLGLYQKDRLKEEWSPRVYRRIAETSVLLLGLGAIGALIAERLADLGFEVFGWSKSQKQLKNVQTGSGEEALNAFIQQTDFIVNTLPLTPATKDFLNYKRLAVALEKPYLINVGRGEHLNEADLLTLLDEDILSGAFLDVFSEEPLRRGHSFWSHEKIDMSPHVAAITDMRTSIDQIVQNIKRLEKGDKLLNEVSRDLMY